MPREYTYGPFRSRRLGLSLGVDILPRFKTCSFNCVYCEIGPTQSVVSPEYRVSLPPSPSFRVELKDIMKYVPHLDSISFGYNGEPTLNENLLDFLYIAREVRDMLNWTGSPPNLTLFTNSSTAYIKEIRERMKEFDVVLAKLDAATQKDYEQSNQPHSGCPEISTIIDSLIKLRKDMPDKKLVIQCLIYATYRKDITSNNNSQNIESIARAINKIKPDIVQLYSIARIPAEYHVYSVDEERKKEIVKKFKEIINNDLIEINYF